MAKLVVRKVDDAMVKTQRGKHSATTKHRRILANALRKPKKKSFAQALAKIPPVGKDSDFKRVES